MWYFTMQKVSDSRPGLLVCATEAEAITQKAQLVSDFPDAVFGDIFEASGEYYCTFPHVIGECTNADGSLDLLWSDGVRTPKPA
jgi:hypothetical protein